MHYEKAWLIQKWERLLSIPCIVLSTENEVLQSASAVHVESPEMLHDLVRPVTEAGFGSLYYHHISDNVCLAAFFDLKGNQVIVGPFGIHRLSRKDEKKIADLQKVIIISTEIRVHSLRYWENAMELFCQDIMQVDSPMSEKTEFEDKAFDYELQEYRLGNTEAEVRRNSFQEILPLIEAVRNGDRKAFEENYDPTIHDRIGKLAVSSYKQTEYLAVKTITLFMHAMIDGGVDYNMAYDLSDLYLQKLEHTYSVQGMYALMERFIREAIEIVRADREQRVHEGIVEEAKNYIYRNLRKDFKIAEMADELHISGSYLSRRFSALEGMTIQQFVLKERLRAACNMLKFSDCTISEIAHILQFSSQSYFSSAFHKEYGLTPKQFREGHELEPNQYSKK